MEMQEEIEEKTTVKPKKDEVGFGDLIRKYKNMGHNTKESIQKSYNEMYKMDSIKNPTKKKKDKISEEICPSVL